jgi:A/G-specific adenine glycosylase
MELFSPLKLKSLDPHNIPEVLDTWFDQNERLMPWRETRDPYRIWLSEIILQQTRVAQGTPYYLAFINQFPTIEKLANAPEDEVLKLWQGLGYYSRARNLHFAAKQVMMEFSGEFPNQYSSILKLKGVGPYTASAIASIAFGEKRAAVDGNVIRVISRLFGISEDTNQSVTQNTIQKLADELIKDSNPGRHNQAMMEFGAMQCVPKNPNCQNCPLSEYCIALKNQWVDQIPLKVKKLKRRSRYFHYFIIQDDSNVWLHRRSENDIWNGLYQFPLIESSSNELNLPDAVFSILGSLSVEMIKSNKAKKHVLSHQDIYATFHHIKVKCLPESSFISSKLNEVHTFALPRLIDRYLESNDF